MLLCEKATYFLFLCLTILLSNNSYSHKTTYATTINIIEPTKEWRIVNNPTSKFAANSGLTNAAALSAGNIWAVGYVYAEDNPANLVPAGVRALIEEWNGDSWHIINSPIIPGASYVSLSHIVALSS